MVWARASTNGDVFWFGKKIMECKIICLFVFCDWFYLDLLKKFGLVDVWVFLWCFSARFLFLFRFSSCGPSAPSSSGSPTRARVGEVGTRAEAADTPEESSLAEKKTKLTKTKWHNYKLDWIKIVIVNIQIINVLISFSDMLAYILYNYD